MSQPPQDPPYSDPSHDDSGHEPALWHEPRPESAAEYQMPPGQPNPGAVAPGPAYGALQPMPQPYGWAPPPDPMAPFGRDPVTGQPYSEKSKVAAGLLQIFLGAFGVGRFYTGHTSTAVTMLVLSIAGIFLSLVLIGYFMLMGVWIWSLIDGIQLLTGRQTDARGFLLRP